MSTRPVEVRLRVRYSETDQMGTVYNSRVLEWFEVGRTELLRSIGTAYADMEDRGVRLPVIEAHVAYLGRARYDDELRVEAAASLEGKAKVRFDLTIDQASTGQGIAKGYTIHAVTDPAGRPIRPPRWFIRALEDGRAV